MLWLRSGIVYRQSFGIYGMKFLPGIDIEFSRFHHFPADEFISREFDVESGQVF